MDPDKKMMAGGAADFLSSGLCDRNFVTLPRFEDWFADRSIAQRAKVERIPFNDLKGWVFDPVTGNLGHETGRFFKIEGVWVETNYGTIPRWTQPIINQPEIGILGILARKINGVLHFLMQAKTEPGNLNTVQLAPTLQATRSNFTRAHRGQQPLYFEYFAQQEKHRPLVDVLQSEQGARFLRKRNRNIILEVFEDVPVHENFIWLTLGQIQQLMRRDNIVNMCTRTVLSCVTYAHSTSRGLSTRQLMQRALQSSPELDLTPPSTGSFADRLLQSELEWSGAVHSNEEVIAWFTRLKFRHDLTVERIPLKYVQEWVKSEDAIYHREAKYFTVLAVRFEAAKREVQSWTQPLVQQRQEGIVAFIVKQIRGVLHFLVQGKVEVGNFDVVEMAPTVQCVTGSYRDASKNECPPFLDYILNARPEQVRYRAMQSEEGGRFFHEQNQNLVIEAGDDFPNDVPSNFMWLTLGQIKQFTHYNNFVNAQARCLISCLGLCDNTEPEVPAQARMPVLKNIDDACCLK